MCSHNSRNYGGFAIANRIYFYFFSVGNGLLKLGVSGLASPHVPVVDSASCSVVLDFQGVTWSLESDFIVAILIASSLNTFYPMVVEYLIPAVHVNLSLFSAFCLNLV